MAMAPGFTGLGAARARAADGFGLGRRCRWLAMMEADFRGVLFAGETPSPRALRRLMPGCVVWLRRLDGDVVRIGLACRRPRQPDLDVLLGRLAAVADFGAAQQLERRGGLVAVPRVSWIDACTALRDRLRRVAAPLLQGISRPLHRHAEAPASPLSRLSSPSSG